MQGARGDATIAGYHDRCDNSRYDKPVIGSVRAAIFSAIVTSPESVTHNWASAPNSVRTASPLPPGVRFSGYPPSLLTPTTPRPVPLLKAQPESAHIGRNCQSPVQSTGFRYDARLPAASGVSRSLSGS